jgi:hypothetical protein
MKHFAYFIAGVLVATFTQAIIAPAQAGGGFFPSLEEGLKRDRAQYQKYLECRDKNPKVVRYECLRLNPLGFKQL